MGAFALDRELSDVSVDNQRAVGKLRTEMRRSASVDPLTGHVQMNRGRVQRVLRAQMTDAAGADRLAAAMAATTARGMAIFGTDPATGAAVPWRVLEQTAVREMGMPPFLREELGTATLRSPDSARAALAERFPGLPDDVFAGARSRLLVAPAQTRFGVPVEIPAALRRPNGDGDPLPGDTDPPDPGDDGTGNGDPHTGPGPITLPTDIPAAIKEAEAVAQCLIGGTWTGWWDGWTGWIPGFKVHLDHDCADRLANTLMGTGGADLAAKALRTALEAGVAAAIKVVASAATLVLPLIGYLLALNIKAVNWAKGTAIVCSWPWTGGIVFWAAAG